jgi:cell division cycle 2-like protein
MLNNIEEGSYGMVSRARRKTTGEIVALKRLKMEHNTDGFPVTGLREIQTLMACRHTNIVNLLEVVMGESLKE